MFKKSGNPKVEELTKSHKERSYRLSDLAAPIINGSKSCIWCLTPLQGRRFKWCSDECVVSALAWARPQTAHGLRVLLDRYENKCAECKFDFTPYLNQAYIKVRRWSYLPKTRFIERYMRAFRKLSPSESRPEVDHVIPVCFGGQAIGLDNVRLLCRPCHKIKTKADNKARFDKFGSSLKGKKFSKDHIEALSKVRKGFDSPSRAAARSKSYEKARISISAVNLKTYERLHFKSIVEAAKALDISPPNISKVLSGQRKQSKGWTFVRSCPACTKTGTIHQNCILR